MPLSLSGSRYISDPASSPSPFHSPLPTLAFPASVYIIRERWTMKSAASGSHYFSSSCDSSSSTFSSLSYVCTCAKSNWRFWVSLSLFLMRLAAAITRIITILYGTWLWSLSMGMCIVSVSTPFWAINLSQVASLLISSGDLCSRSLRAFNSCNLSISSSLCGRNPFVLLGFHRRDGRIQKYQCGHPEYFRQGRRGRSNNCWRGITLSETEKRRLWKVYWARQAREFPTMAAREKIGMGKLIICVRSARDFSCKSLLNIHQPDLNPRIKRIFAVANSVILI